MCLDITKDPQLKVATEDIICYKVVRQSENMLITPYQLMPVEIGKTYISKLIEYDRALGSGKGIDVGLHSFATIKSARIEINDWSLYISVRANGKLFQRSSDMIIIECVIPKGSSYYTGTFSIEKSEHESYASDTLKYIKIIK